MELTNAQARQFILIKQGLLGAHRFAGKAGALDYVRQAGCIQFDPVDVCGKNAELTLQSRVKGVRKQDLQALLYRDRALVDYSDKELAIFPVEDWPCFASYRARSRAHAAQFEGLEALEAQALDYIAAHGPVSSETLPIEGRIFWHSSMHWSGNWHSDSPAARSVLEQLYTDGALVIHHKKGARKFYDLAARHIPAPLLAAPDPFPDRAAFQDWRVLRRIGAVGLLWDRRSDAFLGIDMSTDERHAAFARLLETGNIAQVRAAGLSAPLYLRGEDLPLLEAVVAGEIDRRARCEFLAPLDPMLWDRKLIEALFGFSYSWEIYTPADKRKYGYYVLPVLYGEGFAGRIEAAADAKSGVLTVKNLWLEDGVRRTKKLEAAIARAVKRLARFNACQEIQGLCICRDMLYN